MILKRLETENKIKAMYSSSTILASTFNTDTKDLTIIFKNGGQYKYAGVSLTDYTRFETADSQGIVLNSHIKKYSFEKLDSLDVSKIILEVDELKAAEDKADIGKRTKEMLSNMLKITSGYVLTDKIDEALLSSLEKSIEDYRKASQPITSSVKPVVA